ncbi:hypothetical protein DL89DRAFT_45631 [Linderina pennispora]|uniref:Alpha/beta hydrolase fold-3 domain-containing protein n=1 Tax=Linderina pennispora TaxID=61395 RepID=A0A1Y1W2Y6_9FUNG|nr:uncharacterized protein DL89DRAFT_45631 [Linderina pennispora]ORX67504.1 hypothetical protein DL89DRAFT_45631 [Linderina pennispora]
MVDVGVNMHTVFLPYYANDDNIENIDFHKTLIPLRSCSPNVSAWPREKGIHRMHHIDTKGVAINTDGCAGIPVVGDKLARLAREDVALESPRMLDCEIILGKSAITALEPYTSSSERLLDTVPVVRGEKIVLFFHGGGWVRGSIDTHREFAGELSQVTGTRVVSVGYRLSPEHSFPAFVHDAYIAYCFLLKQGFRSSSIVVFGESAGGQLALSLVHLLRGIGSPAPAGIVLVSPVSNLRHVKPSYGAAENFDCLVDYPLESPMSVIRIMYAPGQPLSEQMKKELESPLVSPIFGSFTGFPPTLIQSGSCEFLYDDNAALYEKIKRQNPDTPGIVQHDVYDGMPHVFQLIFSYRPESAKAMDTIGSFVREL